MSEIIKVGNLSLNFSSPRVMAICNVTNDSYYAQSRMLDIPTLENYVADTVSVGASIIDIGGCSTRPGSDSVDEREELRRVDKAFSLIMKNFPNVILSVDTFRSGIVRKLAEEYGPTFIVNDISGGELDHNMFLTIAEYKLPYIIGHIKGTPKNMMTKSSYSDLIQELIQYFRKKLETLKNLGVSSNIIIDPNFGFAKQLNHNVELLKEISKLKLLNAILMAGVSRKRFICEIAGCEVDDSLPLTSAVHLKLLMSGVNILRVHDTKEAMQVIRLYEKLIN